jgi:FkbM family methyltransferase
MRLRDRVGRVLRAFGGAFNGMVYDRMAATDQELARIGESLERIANQNQASARLQSARRGQSSAWSDRRPVPPNGREELPVFARLVEAGFLPSVIYDIGAADGRWSAEVAEIFPDARFHLFEPLADFLPAYRSSLDTELGRHPNFTLHPVALGAERGQVRMCIKSDGYSSTILDVGDHPEFQVRHEVTQWCLDDFVEQHGLALPDFIKLDTQASEVLILSQAARCLDHASFVFAETWFDHGYGPGTPLITELSALLHRHEYQLVELGHMFYDENHRLYGCDAFYLKRSLLYEIAPMLPPDSW